MVDLAFTEDQLSLRDLARRIFTGMVTVDRLREIEAEPDRIDRTLWTELARTGLLDPRELGGLLEVCILLEEQGRSVAPVPLWPTLVAKLAIGEFAPHLAAGADAILTVALPADGDVAGDPTAADVAAPGGAEPIR